MLAGAAICCVSRRQHCITMSSCESELVALADCAIELLHIIEVVKFLGHDISDAVEVCTDSKAAFDLCHRFTSAQHSRHIDRKGRFGGLGGFGGFGSFGTPVVS